MKSRNIVILIVVVVLAVGGFTAYRMWNKPHKTVEDETTIKLSVGQLATEYASNPDSVTLKYLNKALEITGAISEVSTNQDGYTFLVLHDEDASADVACTMREKGLNLTSGQEVTVKGFYADGDMFGVKLTDCVIAK